MFGQQNSASFGSMRSGGLGQALGRNNDLVLAMFVLAVVALFILPLPPALIDVMIVANLAVSIVLLTVSIYIPSALSLSTFPSLLLFTTLLRLSLNIASSKLILLHASAGHVIETFGKLVIGNNVVVGGVVFLVIAIVQFIVIAKGSERVAEVGARFTLDAMPGKQMSIDADLRAGLITSDEAKRRRDMLGQESQLHGAMDGAMKFVKGDAIASIVIALINILAGIAIGTLMHDMSVSEALRRYAILTVGDGMASQIPSLLVSIAAGVVITRVASPEGVQTHLGQQISSQILAHPRALMITGGILLSFAFVPGFPKWVFGLFAVLFCGGGLVLTRLRRAPLSADVLSVANGDPNELAGAVVPGATGIGVLLMVRVSEEARNRLNPQRLHKALSSARGRVQSDIGQFFPRVHLVFDRRLDADSYEILVQDVVSARGSLDGKVMAQDETDQGKKAAMLDAYQRLGRNGLRQEQGTAKDEVQQDMTPEEMLARHVAVVVTDHAGEMLGMQETQNLVHLVQRELPDLVAELTRTVPLQRISEVLRRLLAEHIPIRNLRAIFESLIVWAPKEQDIVALVESVRIDLKHLISDRYSDPGRALNVVLFDQGLEAQIGASIQRTPNGNFLGLDPRIADEIRRRLIQIVEEMEAGQPLVILVSMDIRRYVKSLIEPAVKYLPVLSYQEIGADVVLKTVGQVGPTQEMMEAA
jgi:type III secretion protein V